MCNLKIKNILFSVIIIGLIFVPSKNEGQQTALLTESHLLAPKVSQPVLEIDSDSFKVVDQVGGGIYDKDVDSLVPFFPSLVREKWMQDKNEIARRIGPIDPGPAKESVFWKNSATSVPELIQDAELTAPYFLKMSQSIAKATGSEINFGIDNQYMIKSKNGIERKVDELMKEGFSKPEAVEKIRDTLRGTIIVNSPEQIPLVVDALRNYAKKFGREVSVANIWEENRTSGYVGIHTKMLFPIFNKEGMPTERNIVVELQIHLKCIMNGTMHSVKEREHLLYELMREHNVDAKVQSAASTLLFLTALEECLGETQHC